MTFSGCLVIMKQPTCRVGISARTSVQHVSRANCSVKLLSFTILYLISFLLLFAAIEALQAHYYNPNESAIRTVLRYSNRDCHELLGYIPTYRYSAPRRSRVTDFLRASSPPPDPTLPDVPLIWLTEAEKMAKRSRIKNLITAISTELPSISPPQPLLVNQVGPWSRWRQLPRCRQARKAAALVKGLALPIPQPSS
ncbi:hypothetical protein HYC85_029497 [Camellia sinensis]|uniref:Uncharacterized protein n=1 Tax=Camellia sinensis TaxID=4442 RepID=A0A7J7G268_CAMSI|nr:hypothetical protein HYC85_029497 [Camellia sinensis]